MKKTGKGIRRSMLDFLRSLLPSDKLRTIRDFKRKQPEMFEAFDEVRRTLRRIRKQKKEELKNENTPTDASVH